jgi:Mn-dependent DtxR family transcriptional regulator
MKAVLEVYEEGMDWTSRGTILGYIGIDEEHIIKNEKYGRVKLSDAGMAEAERIMGRQIKNSYLPCRFTRLSEKEATKVAKALAQEIRLKTRQLQSMQED